MMLQQPQPEDFVLATGETHPVREFVEKAFAVVGTSIQYVIFCGDLGMRGLDELMLCNVL